MDSKLSAPECAKLFQALADAHRLRIIHCLREGEKNVSELANLLNVAIVNVSHHLGVLNQANLVRNKKQGRYVLYSLHPDFFTVNDDMTCLELGGCRLELSVLEAMAMPSEAVPVLPK